MKNNLPIQQRNKNTYTKANKIKEKQPTNFKNNNTALQLHPKQKQAKKTKKRNTKEVTIVTECGVDKVCRAGISYAVWRENK